MTTFLLDATVTERFCAPFVMQAMVFISFFEPRRALQLLASTDTGYDGLFANNGDSSGVMGICSEREV